MTAAKGRVDRIYDRLDQLPTGCTNTYHQGVHSVLPFCLRIRRLPIDSPQSLSFLPHQRSFLRHSTLQLHDTIRLGRLGIFTIMAAFGELVGYGPPRFLRRVHTTWDAGRPALEVFNSS
jgi:hypothetical protein